MIEQEEYETSIDRLINDIDEKGRKIDKDIAEIRQLLSSLRSSPHHGQGLLHTDSMLEKSGGGKELALSDEAPKSIVVFIPRTLNGS